jgi:hypothetical protein
VGLRGREGARAAERKDGADDGAEHAPAAQVEAARARGGGAVGGVRVADAARDVDGVVAREGGVLGLDSLEQFRPAAQLFQTVLNCTERSKQKGS